MSAARLQACFAAWAAGLMAVYYSSPAVSDYAWAVLEISAGVAIVVGARVHRPGRRLPWYLLAAVLAGFTAGDTAYNLLPGPAFPSVADVFYLLCYPLLAAALLMFVRARPAGNRAALLDALVPTAGLGLLAWVFLIAPYAHDGAFSVGAKVISAAYPVGDLLALAMLFRLLASGGRRPPALTLLAGGVTCLLISDVLYGPRQLAGDWQLGGPTDAGWVFFYVATGLAALHPSMGALTEGGPSVAGGGRGWRVATLVVAALVAPAVLVVEDLAGDVSDALVVAVASAVMFLLVLARAEGLLRAQRADAARERALRIAGADLVTASSGPEVHEAVGAAVAGLVPPGEPYRLHTRALDVPPEVPAAHLGVRRVAVAGLPAADAEALAPFGSALLAEMITTGGSQRHLQAYLAAPDGVLTAVLSAFEAVMLQGATALDRIMLTDEISRRSSEDYFRALIQSASDVILIVGDDELIRYASPSALPVFGRTDLVGTPLHRLVAGTDHGELRHLLDRARSGKGPRDGVDLTAISGDDLLLQVECTCRDLRGDPAVAGLVVTIRDVTERRRLESDLAYQAYHDSLTGLANRALFQQRLEQAALSAAGTVGVLFVDLDDFKEVNDSLGHAAGDQLLIAVGHRIAGAAGPGNVAARTGGDEFAVLVERAGAAGEAERVAAAIVAALAEPIEVSDGAGGAHLVSAAASVGVATSDEATGIADLLGRADVAMYLAKTRGKNTWQRYQDDLHEAMRRRLEMRTALNEAVPGDQMRLRYQPIVDLPSGDLVGVEALVRWQHPARGLLGPQEFIELSEENGAVVAIGGWVLREALRTFAGWRRAAPGSPLRYVSVNVSARQFRTPGFVDLVRAVLAETGSRPQWLLLEITESLVLHDADQVWRDLRELRALGVRIAIDDFGTGYSSLSYLSQMPADILKIDKSFIDDILHNDQQMALVETIVSLARRLDLAVVAEGIELAEHQTALAGMGCPYGQGYLFSKPVTADEITGVLTGEPVA